MKKSVETAATIWIDKPVHRQLSRFCDQKGLKMRFVANMAVRQLLDREKAKAKQPEPVEA